MSPGIPARVRAVLLSSGGAGRYAPFVEAARGWLGGSRDALIAHISAASLVPGGRLDEVRALFAGIARVEAVGAGGWSPSAGDRDLVDAADVLHIPGGNTYVLADRLRKAGLHEVVRQRVLAGTPLLAFSAGTVLCGPSIVSTNDWNVVATTAFEGLGLLPFHVNVHYPVHEDGIAERDARVDQFLRARGQPVVALEDDARLEVAEGMAVLRGGRGWIFTPGVKTELARDQAVVVPQDARGGAAAG